ncbi:hypothetical protein [Nitrosomonas sp.]|uniref:hypothetical protein n=1 Tax=Nitrosomonas sp. TaxID=42353 RepID=UPI0025CE1A4D|nr:hypothetical protein [Nitrosomonas sp.]
MASLRVLAMQHSRQSNPAPLLTIATLDHHSLARFRDDAEETDAATIKRSVTATTLQHKIRRHCDHHRWEAIQRNRYNKENQ